MTQFMPGEPEAEVAGSRQETGASHHLVITVHGIRTFGDWQADLKRLLEQAEPGIKVLNYQYGYFSSLAFLVPPLRWLVARRFRRFFVEAMKTAPPGTRIELIAHSFGTHLAASALPAIPQGQRVNTVIFAGSVLRPSFPWYRYLQDRSVDRVVNDCGWDDSILLLCQFTALMMGMAGRVGFQGMVGEHFTNRYFRFGHGGYFDREQRFMREKWLPLLTSNVPATPFDERPPLTAWGGLKLFMMNNLQFLKVAAAVLLMMALIWFPIDWARKADYKKRADRLGSISRLANAVQIPGRDPTHVKDLLRVDASHDAGDESKIDQSIGTEVAPEGEDDPGKNAEADDTSPAWWERIPGIRDTTREANRARRIHALANFQIAAGKNGRSRDRSKAKLLYEQAIRSYQQIINYDPAHGSFALCLLDYGLLLQDMGLNKEACDQFKKVRDDVFPKNEMGERPTMPKSLAVDSLCSEASALEGLERWDDAATCLWKAKEQAGKDDALLSAVFNELAWLGMERLDITKAKDHFGKARECCERLVDKGQLDKTRLFHVRHGQAMSQRLCGQSEESYNQYDQLVKELQELMRKDFNFYPKERRDLNKRLVNSMERRADVWFFSRRSTVRDNVIGVGDEPAITDASADEDTDVLRRVERDYQEAITQVENDDLSTKARLLYKKVITHLRGSGSKSSVAEDRTATRDGDALTTVDTEFAEAERTYNSLAPELRKELKIYHELTGRCMRIYGSHRISPLERTQAIAELRVLTGERARKCETLKRDDVEMLLVALEILLDLGDGESVKSRVEEDASRMLAVVGATMKVASHDELRPYVDRFNRIASARLATRRADPRFVTQTSRLLASEPRESQARAVPRANVVFFLKLSPKHALMVAEGGDLDAVVTRQLPMSLLEAAKPEREGAVRNR
jgi:tetratricopeptide (TPR) repeat protein